MSDTLTPGGATGELKMVEPCPHDISEQDVALQADGLCPLCLLSKLEAYRKALEDAQERLANISSGRCPNAPPGTGGPVAFREWAAGYADIGYSVVRTALAAGG